MTITTTIIQRLDDGLYCLIGENGKIRTTNFLKSITIDEYDDKHTIYKIAWYTDLEIKEVHCNEFIVENSEYWSHRSVTHWLYHCLRSKS